MSAALVTYPPERVFAGNPVRYQVQSSSFAGLDNYRVVFRVLFEKSYGSGTFEQLVELEDTPGADGFTDWNIQSVIEAALMENTVLQVPDTGGSSAYIADNLRRFKVAFAEKHGQPAAVQPFAESAVSTAYQGGIDMHTFADTDYLAGIGIDNPFLTWMPGGQKVGGNQPAYLTWFNYTNGTVGLVAGWTAWSATGQFAGSGAAATVQVPSGRALVIPVGPEQLGIADVAAVKYRVKLLDENAGDSDVSRERFYYIDRKPAHCGRSLLWFNSFNQPETLRLTGRTSTRLDIERQVFTRALPHGYNPLDGEIRQHRADWENTYTYRTGYLRKREVDALQDLLVRNLVFEISDGGCYRMHLTGKKYSITECLQFLHSLELGAVRSIRPVNFSRAAAGTPAGHWELGNSGYYLTAPGGRFELAQ